MNIGGGELGPRSQVARSDNDLGAITVRIGTQCRDGGENDKRACRGPAGGHGARPVRPQAVDQSAQCRRIERVPHAATLCSARSRWCGISARLWITPRCQLDAAAAGAELVELEPLDELELDLSDDDLSDDDLSEDLSDEDEVVDSELLLLEPLIVLLAASRLSVR